MSKFKSKGKFIVFEGLDGSGKTTQFKMLAKYLKENKKNISVTKEPTRGRIGKTINEILEGREKVNHVFLQLLFSCDRAEHLEREIIPALKRGKTVLCDRYLFSTLAYGNSEIGDLVWLQNLGKHFILPDITFFIDVSPKESIRRIKDVRKKKETLFEKEKKLKKVRQNYKILSKKYKNFYIIDGERNKNEVFADIKNIIAKKIK
jgi:dTMP kinase